MTFVEAVKTCVVTKYMKFDGRASRSEFWWFMLAYFILGQIVNVIQASVPALNPWLNLIMTLALLLPSIGVWCRRLHDVNKSGWFMLIPIYNIILACQKGADEANKYGEPAVIAPKNTDTNAAQ